MRGWIGRTLSKRPRRLLTIAAAFVAFAGLMAGGGDRVLKSYESLTSADRLVEVSAVLSGTHEMALPVTLIEVDEEARQRWGYSPSLITPRPAIAKLIELARDNRARAILIDLDLSSDDGGSPADELLRMTLEDYPPFGRAPVLLLVRVIGFRNQPKTGGGQDVAAAVLRPTPYDVTVAKQKSAEPPNIIWVSALPETDSDGVVRKLRMWQTVCDGKTGAALPSPALVVAAAARDPPRLADLARFLDHQAAKECGDETKPRPDWPPTIEQVVDIPYSLSEEMPSRLLRVGASSMVLYSKEKGASIVDSAHDFPFKSRLVVIGATHADSRDLHLTPLGAMPGALILANSMAMAHPMVEPPQVSSHLRNLLAAGLFAAFAVIAAYLHGLIAAALIFLIGIGTLIAGSPRLGFGAAVQILALAITLFALFKVLDAAAGIVFDWQDGLGWRALLKERPKTGGR